MSERTSWTIYESPFGRLALEAGPRGLRGLHFPGGSGHLDERDRQPAAEAAGVLADAATQLAEYFARECSAFELELDLGGTPFQRGVWEQLAQIPYGSTISYTELARRAGRPDRARAAGAAVGRIPVPIVVPCHRVVASNGALTGYRGGLELKRALLELEARSDQAGTDVPASARPQRPGTPVSATWPSSAGTWGSLRSPAGVGARPSIVVSASSGAAAAQACGAEAVG